MARLAKVDVKATSKRIEQVSAKMKIIGEKLADLEPALYTIADEFSLMEATRFKNGGFAYEWGITDMWAAPDPQYHPGYPNEPTGSTVGERASKGGNSKNQPLFNHGYLAAAATMPELRPFGHGGLDLVIDPSKRAPQSYSHGRNYGAYHQTGTGNMPKREFVTITPEFYKIAAKIIEFYVMSPKEQAANKSNKEYFTPRDEEAGRQARRDRGDIKRRATMSHQKEKGYVATPKYSTFGENSMARSVKTRRR